MFLTEEEILRVLEESDLEIDDIDDELSEETSGVENLQRDEPESFSSPDEEIPATEVQDETKVPRAEPPQARSQRWKIGQFK